MGQQVDRADIAIKKSSCNKRKITRRKHVEVPILKTVKGGQTQKPLVDPRDWAPILKGRKGTRA